MVSGLGFAGSGFAFLALFVGSVMARRHATTFNSQASESEFLIDNLLVRIHYIIVMIRSTGLATWEFKFPLAKRQYMLSCGLKVNGQLCCVRARWQPRAKDVTVTTR